MIECGWCGGETKPGRCSACGREPIVPWTQRGLMPPAVTSSSRNRRLLAEAEKALREEGREPTVDRVAEHLGIDPRTVRRWRAVSS